MLVYKDEQFVMTKIAPRKVYMFLEDGASGVQVGDIEQAVV